MGWDVAWGVCGHAQGREDRNNILRSTTRLSKKKKVQWQFILKFTKVCELYAKKSLILKLEVRCVIIFFSRLHHVCVQRPVHGEEGRPGAAQGRGRGSSTAPCRPGGRTSCPQDR